MRPQRIDISGTTDKNGNASIPVKLPLTGEWFDLKFPLSLPAAAEWAILAGGTPLTYGRGRRVTLGPELIQSGETVTVTVTGGPPNAAIIGSANGRSGDPAAILAGFVPSPNTIALDTAAPQSVMGTLTQIAGGAAVSLSKVPVPPGTQSIGFIVEANIFPASIIIQPDQTLANTGATAFPNVGPYWFPWDAKDTTVSFQMTPTATNGCTVDFLASALVEPNLNPGAVVSGQPGLWQAANQPPVQFSVVLNAGVAMVIVTATPGQSVYLFCLNSTTDTTSAVGLLSLQDTAGTGYHVSSNNSNTNPGPALFAGGKLPSALGAQIKNIGTASLIARGSLAYSQGSP